MVEREETGLARLSETMAKIKIDKFLELIAESNLLPPDLLARVRRRVDDSKGEVDPRSVAKWLVEKQYLTLWQAKQLLAGRSRFYLGRYKLLDRIGKGGMGVVFRAQHAVMDRTVALKVMARHLLNKPRAVERFNREVKTAAALHHPNIITAFDADRVGNTHFLVMEFVDGVDLNSWLRTRGPLPVAAACECIMQAAEGLSHAAAMGMVHRDVKPVNLLVTWNGEKQRPVVKLLDMGLARFVSETQEDGGLTRVGQTIGTPDYIAPEAAENFKHADIRADIFSLGCTLFRVLTGKLPYGGENTMEKLIARATQDAPRARSVRPDVPAELDDVIAKILARDPSERYQTPGEVVEALRPFAASTTGDKEALEFFSRPPSAKEALSAAALEPEADTSLEEFFRDFSFSPVREDSATPEPPGPAPPAAASDDLELAPLDEDPASRALGVSPPSKSPAKERPVEPQIPDAPLLGGDDLAGVDQMLGGSLDEGAGSATTGTSRSRGTAARVSRAKVNTKAKGKENTWDTNLILIGGGSLLALVLAALTLWWVLTRETGDQALALAEQEYRNGSYTQAIHRYDLYLENYPTHTGNSLAVVHRGLAQLRQAVEAGGDWSATLETTQRVLREISPEAEFGEARGDLASLLPRVATGLAEQAREKKQPELVDQTRDAVELVRRFVPQNLLPEAQLAEIDALLALTEREMDRDAALATAIDEIRAAANSGTPSEAYAIRTALLKTYPDVEQDEALGAAVLEVTAAQQAAVTTTTDTRPAATTPPESPIVASVALADRAGSDASGVDGQVVYALVDGAAYGLDGPSGELLWRHYVGFDTQFVPTGVQDSGGADAIFVDSARHELWRVAARDGTLRWRQSLDESLGAAPLILQDRLLVPTQAGNLTTINLASGEVVSTTHLGSELTVSPAVGADQQIIYQLADHSSLFVLRPDGSCEAVVYLAHDPGSIRVPPVVVGRYVILLENNRFDKSRLRVLLTDEEGLALQPVQSIELDGHVYVAPLVQGRTLSVMTDRGALYTFEMGTPDQASPLTRIANTPPDGRTPTLRFFLQAGGQLFVADDRLTKFDVQAAAGRLSPQWVNNQGDVFLQPLQSAGDVLFHVRRRASRGGASVAAIRMSDGQRIWETEIAVPLAAAPLASGENLVALSSNGALFDMPASDASLPQVVDQPAQRVNLSSSLEPQHALIELDGNMAAAAEGLGKNRVLLINAQDATARPRLLTLPDKLGGPLASVAGGLLVPGQVGQVFLLDASTGRGQVEPFQPALKVGREYQWSVAPSAESEVVLSDGREKLYRVGIVAEPTPHLAALNEAELPSPLAAPLAPLAEAVAVVDERQRLQMFSLPALQPAGESLIEADVTWGPYRAGDVILLATADERLRCFGPRAEPLWQVELSHGALQGAPSAAEGQAVLATNEGIVYRVALADGAEQNQLDIQRPLATGLVRAGEQWVVAGSDGSLYFIPRP